MAPCRSILVAGLSASALAALPARAQAPAEDATQVCIAAHVDAQRLQKAGKLRDARAAVIRCADPACPAVLIEECGALFTSLEKAIPTVVFAAQDADGHDIATVRVQEGEATIAPRLDGKAVEVDPGEHRFRFERPGAPPVETTVVVREGERGRRVAVRFAGAAKLETAAEGPITPAFWAVGAVGLTGLALFGALGGAGLAERANLDDRGCAPRCPTDDVDLVRSLFLGADVSLGVGLAALATAPILYFAVPREPASAPSASLWLAPAALSGRGVVVRAGGSW
jgi:hypothetical protein